MGELVAILPALMAMLASLLGVFLGSLLTRRVQGQQWSRDRQSDACMMIMRESNRVQFGLYGLWRGKDRPDWVPWNEALVTLTLVGHSDLVRAALAVDETFWVTKHSIETGEVRSEAAWAQVRESIEQARLQFVNETRRRLVGEAQDLSHFVARPPLPPSPAAVEEDTSVEGQGTTRADCGDKQPESMADVEKQSGGSEP